MSNAEVATYERIVSGNPVYDDDLRIAPWKIEDAGFAVSTDRELIGKALDNIKEEHSLLVLASADGCRYGNTILIKFDAETLSIDKPIDFTEIGIPSFRIYFQDITGVWGFFEVETINDCPFSLCASFPDTIYRLQKRRYHRVNLPEGTKAVFRQGGNLHGDCLVKNISASGMLICTDNVDEKFVDNANISAIALALPRCQSSGKSEGEGQVVLPVVSKGRIVRSFGEQGTDLIYHGISFKGDSTVMAELGGFVDKIKKGGHND